MEPAKDRSSQSDEVAALIHTMKKTLSEADPAGPATRQHLKEVAERLSIALETPGETVQRVAYYVSSTSDINPPHTSVKRPLVCALS